MEYRWTSELVEFVRLVERKRKYIQTAGKVEERRKRIRQEMLHSLMRKFEDNNTTLMEEWREKLN